jgi:VCBS repeat-containing protein
LIYARRDNQPPAAANDEYDVNEDQTLVKDAAEGVERNDSDPDGDALTAWELTPPTNGVLDLRTDGSFTYRPNANYNGPDSFTYTVTDGILVSAPATVTITVNSVNDAPVAENDTGYSVTAGESLAVNDQQGVLSNDSDDDTPGAVDHLMARLVDGPEHASGFDLDEDGSFDYTPELGWTGIDVFTYRADDGEDESNLATVQIEVDPSQP